MTFKAILGTILLLTMVGLLRAQESLPDAPVSAATCTQANGKPCPEWLHKLIGPYPVPPDQIYQWKQFDQKPAGLFTFRPLGAPVLHPNKKCLALFVATHAAMFTAYALTNHTTERPISEIPAMIGLTALDFGVFKLINPAMGIAPPVYGAVHYYNAR